MSGYQCPPDSCQERETDEVITSQSLSPCLISFRTEFLIGSYNNRVLATVLLLQGSVFKK